MVQRYATVMDRFMSEIRRTIQANFEVFSILVPEAWLGEGLSGGCEHWIYLWDLCIYVVNCMGSSSLDRGVLQPLAGGPTVESVVVCGSSYSVTGSACAGGSSIIDELETW